MKKIFTLSTMLNFFCFVAYCQDQNTTSSFKHDIGFNTNFVLSGIFNSSTTPFSLMYKTYKAENKALRFGLNAYVDLNKVDDNISSSQYTETTNVNVSISIGKEFQRSVSNKWTFYFGADLVPFYKLIKLYQQYNSNYNYTSEDSSYGLGVNPFLGIRFNIHERIYIAAETNVNLKYSFTSIFSKASDQDPTTDIKGNKFSYSMTPAYGLFVFYRF